MESELGMLDVKEGLGFLVSARKNPRLTEKQKALLFFLEAELLLKKEKLKEGSAAYKKGLDLLETSVGVRSIDLMFGWLRFSNYLMRSTQRIYSPDSVDNDAVSKALSDMADVGNSIVQKFPDFTHGVAASVPALTFSDDPSKAFVPIEIMLTAGADLLDSVLSNLLRISFYRISAEEESRGLRDIAKGMLKRVVLSGDEKFLTAQIPRCVSRLASD